MCQNGLSHFGEQQMEYIMNIIYQDYVQFSLRHGQATDALSTLAAQVILIELKKATVGLQICDHIILTAGAHFISSQFINRNFLA